MNNIFNFAAGELSQDSFICWLINWINYKEVDEQLYLKAKKILDIILHEKRISEYKNVAVYKDYYDMNIVVVVNDKYVIVIEDKAFEIQSDENIVKCKKQIISNNYKNIPLDIKKEEIICVYCKAIEEINEDKHADLVIHRKDILELLKDTEGKIHNDIYKDYANYFIGLDEEINEYKYLGIHEWNDKCYMGFFNYLSDYIIKNVVGWRYVSETSGNYWALWWYHQGAKLKATKFSRSIDNIYLQIENNTIAVKITHGVKYNNEIWWYINKFYRDRCKEKGFKFNKKSFRTGNYMTVGYIEYDEKNYEEAIRIMEQIMDQFMNKIED